MSSRDQTAPLTNRNLIRSASVTTTQYCRCVYQWAVALEEGEESGEELPDPPACNAPPPKALAGGEDGEEEEEADGGDDEDGEQPAAAAWSGDDEDLIENATHVRWLGERGWLW